MLFYEFNLRPQPQRIYVFLKRGGEIFKKPRTPRPAAPKSTTTAAETICRSLPYQYVCYFEVPASSETRLLNLRFMLFYEFNLRPQPQRIYVFLKRGGEIFKKPRTPKPVSPNAATAAAETKCHSLPYQYVCFFEVPASSELRLINLLFMLFYEFNLRPQPQRIYVFLKRGGEIFKKPRTPKPVSPNAATAAAETKCHSLPYQYVCFFEVPASSELRLINLLFMLFYEFDLRTQPKRIYVLLKRGGEIFKKSRNPRPAAPKSATTAAETKCRSLPY